MKWMGTKWALIAALLVGVCLLSACGSTKDSVSDPLASYDIDAVIPFATAAPEAIAPTPTPAPTPVWDTNNSDGTQNWREDNTVSGEDPLEPDTPSDDWQPSIDPTPRPTQKPSSGYESLSRGDAGTSVTKLQNRLKSLGYYSGTVDGVYGSGTVTAVKLFQQMTGFEENGVASAAVQKELYAKNAPEYVARATPAPTPQYETLSKGDAGTGVSRLQKRLTTLGYYTGSVDGTYGVGTVNAVKRFQAALGVAKSGVANAALQKKLYSANAPYYEAPDKPDPTPVPDPDAYQRLGPGAYGTQVKRLQNRLKSLGYFQGTPDGDYGSATTAAVKRFQRVLGLTQTGVATVSLQKKIYSSNAPAYEEDEPQGDTYKQLSPGDSGEPVKKLQRRLKALGYFDGEIGGNYLTKTTDAVKRFQRALGLTATGVATASLQKKLFSDSAPYYDEPIEPEPTDDPSGYGELSEGDTGDRVYDLQQRLADLGYYNGTVNGKYNADTVAAVKRFEARYGKPKTGVATIALQKKLFSDSALPAKGADDDSGEYEKLSKGDTGTRVKKLQRRLKELGYFEGAIGGNYQQLTIEAVKRFQKALGLEATGVANASLQATLFSDDAPYAGSGSPTPTPSYKTLKKGNKGDEVKRLQARLFDLGFIKNANDVKSGTFDLATMYAVIEVQLARGYDASDGVADSEFLEFIYSDAAWDLLNTDFDAEFQEEGDAASW